MPSSSLNKMTVPLASDQSASTQGLLMPKLRYRFRVMFENFGTSTPTTGANWHEFRLTGATSNNLFYTKNDVITLTLALSYSSREEIVNAIKNISKKVVNKELNIEEINENIINNHLYTFNLPDVDLMIRTSGEQRISNFLLWQMAYAELYFTNILWPDFRKEHFYDAIIEYQNRERRFGKTSDQITITE